MKKRISFLISFLFAVLLFVSSFKQSELPPYLAIKGELKSSIEQNKKSNQTLLRTIKEGASKEALRKGLKKCREDFKRYEHHVIFNYPALHKRINGGPVFGVKVDVVKLYKVEPSGYQVLEELFAESKIDTDEVIHQLTLVQADLDQLNTLFERQQFGYWHIFEAERMQINTMITLSLSGFDSPVLLNGLEESKVSLKQSYSEFKQYKTLVANEGLNNEISLLYTKGIAFLEDVSFEEFDRFRFIRDVTEPLSHKLLEFHRQSGYEMWHEVNPNKRGFNYQSLSLFSKDFLNPYYSMRGKNTHVQELQSEMVNLGEILFFDPILSKNNERACASCHSPDKGFSDNRAKSLAFDFKGTVNRNSPTIINACFQSEFFWDMRSNDLNNQISHVVESEKEFNTSFEEIVEKLKKSDAYKEEFLKVYPNANKAQVISVGRIKDAIEAYVRSKQSMNSPFDKYIRREQTNVPKEIIAGFNLFMGKAACGTCHFPPNFNGLVPPHYNDTEGEILGVTASTEMKELDTDWGRYDLHKGMYPNDTFIKGMFKTPTIRNIELTAPYMHNGAFPDLESVVDFYNKGGGVGLGHNLPSQTLSSDSLSLTNLEIKDLIQFMNALTDTIGLNNVPAALPLFGDDALDKRVVGGVY